MKNVPYTEKNLDDNPDFEREVINKSGIQLVPLIFVGDNMISGANIGALANLLFA